jgi:hypothetical protein
VNPYNVLIIFLISFALTLNAQSLTIGKCDNCTEMEWTFIKAAQLRTNATISSTCFASFMLQRELIQTDGKSNKEVIDSLGVNTKIDIEMYWSSKNVYGYTYPSVNKEWINRRYMVKMSRCELASLLGHETSHKKGYKHDFNYSPSRQFSVPYSVNAAFKECCL